MNPWFEVHSLIKMGRFSSARGYHWTNKTSTIERKEEEDKNGNTYGVSV
jgi:hypothetical protein